MSTINFDFFNKFNEPESRAVMITIPFDLPDVWVLESYINEQGETIITVESKLQECKCKHCHRKITAFHKHDEWITIRHLSVLGRPTYLRLQPKRYNCVWCAHRKEKKKVTTTQQLSWHQAKSPYSRPYKEQVLLQLVNSTIEDVSVKEGLGYDGVVGIVERNVRIKVDWAEFTKLEVLGIDEIALKKGHKDYVVIITARLANGQVKILTVLPDRKKKTVKKFLRSIPKPLQKTIHTICLDMWKHYK